MTANKWYTLKCRVDVAADGSGVVQGQGLGKRRQPSPMPGPLRSKVPRAHTNGSPGIFGFTPLNQKRMYLDNLSVTPNN
jgi:outer membrane protein assembly factor BamB